MPNETTLKVDAILTSANSVPVARGSARAHHLTDAAAEGWDRFVVQQSRGTLFHTLAWKRVIEQTFGFKSCYAYAERDGKVTGIAPLFSISNWIVGRCLISTPYAVYGGICAADEQSEEVLLEFLKDQAYSQEVDYLELRYREREVIPGFAANPLYATFTAPLSADHEANLKRLPKDTRYMIRKATKAGLTSKRGMEQMGSFYRLFATSMKRLGTPVFPRALFENLAREFSKNVDLLMVYREAEPVSGVFSFRFRDTIYPYYAGASDTSAALAANNFMYAELMRIAGSEGCREFDFGRSKKGTGAYAFKTQWNMNIAPLSYQIHLVRRKELPNFTPLNPKFERAARIWRRMPIGLTKLIGPRVVRWFP
jgi:FemAB-related protein (PEP-CTERM system-associated)